MAEVAAAATVATATETAAAIEMAMVTAMTLTLMPSALPLNAQQVVQKISRHKSGRCSSLTGQNHQKSHLVPYYIHILLHCLGMFNLGIISTFFTLRSFFINLE
jgi:hypothetical protein